MLPIECCFFLHSFFVVWSLELASEIFHDFLLIILAGKTRFQLSSPGQNSRKNTVAIDARLERNLASRKGILVTKNARSGVKEFAAGM